MTHPLAEALIAVLDRIDSMGDCSESGQASWNAQATTQGGVPRVGIAVRFAQKNEPTAHQQLAYKHGQDSLKSLLNAITGPMDSLPAVSGAGFQWVFTLHDNSKFRRLALRYGTQAIASGKKAEIAQTIHQVVDLLTKLPAHQGRVYAVGNQRFPAAGPQEAFALWTALQHSGQVDAATMEETASDLQQNPSHGGRNGRFRFPEHRLAHILVGNHLTHPQRTESPT
jgi:hypothetical protein